MDSGDIRDLVGRYATGSLSADEEKRLFAASLEDQELFDELAQEGNVKMLLAEPGARDRMMQALAPAKKKWGWWFGGAAVALATVVMVVLLLHPKPKPIEVAANQPAAPVSTPAAAPEPADAAPPPPPEPAPAKPISSAAPNVDAPKEAKKKAAAENEVVKSEAALDKDIAAMAAPVVSQQQQAPGGPRQNQQAPSRATSATFADKTAAAFGFHYSVQTKGHLTIIALADGFLSVKGADGATLFEAKAIAAGISVDVPLADSVSVVNVSFSTQAGSMQAGAVSKQARTTSAVEDNVTGTSPVAVEIRIKQ